MDRSLLAAIRFGLGVRPGGPSPTRADLDAQVARGAARPIEGLRPVAEAIVDLPLPPNQRPPAQQAAAPQSTASQPTAPPAGQDRADSVRRTVRDLALRAAHLVRADDGLAERMTLFWGNLLTVSANGKPLVGGLAASYENEALRPRVFGRFADLLRAATVHPAMNLYLDGVRNVGPGSPAGRRRGGNINENHARELLELHTVGVGAGYGQDDVIALSKLLSGWRLDRPTGAVLFDERLHEPGPKRILGRTFAGDGARETDALIAFLAMHPATIRRISLRIATHFVSDRPSDGLVDALVAAWTRTEGDIAAVMAALLDHPEAWAGEPAKLRTNEEWVIAAARLVGLRDDDRPGGAGPARDPAARLGGSVLQMQRRLGQAPFTAPSPKGWPDEEAAWLTPANVVGRVDVAARMAANARGLDPRALVAAALPWAARSTRDTVDGAPSVADGVALVLASAEFQRR